MKIKFLATGTAPEKYEFDGYKIIIDGEAFDLSQEFEDEELPFGVRDVKNVDGEIYATLCQKAPKGHWTGEGIDYIDSKDYDPEKLYIRERTPDEISEISNNELF